jgi:hypothetical protein
MLAAFDLQRLDLPLARDALLLQRPLRHDLGRLDRLPRADLRALAVHLPFGPFSHQLGALHRPLDFDVAFL